MRIKIYKIILFALTAMVLIYEMSPLHTEILLICGILGSPLFVKKYYKLSKDEKRVLLASMIYLILMFFYKLLEISTCDISYIAMYIDWNVVLVYSLYMKVIGLSTIEKKHYLYIIYCLVLIQFFVSIINAWAMEPSIIIDGLSGLRTTEFGSMAMFFGAGNLIWFFNDKKRKHCVMALVGVIISVLIVMVIQQRAINAVCTVFLLSWIWVHNSEKKRQHYYIVILGLFLIVFSIAGELYVPIIDFIVSNIRFNMHSVRLAERIEELKDILLTLSFFEPGRLSGRSELIVLSLSQWLYSPMSFFVGIGDHRGDDSIIGNHCEYVDILARYGLLGGILNLFISILIVKILLSYGRHSVKIYSQIMAIAIVFIFRNFLGNIFVYQVGVPMLLFTQCVISYCKDVSIKVENG